MSICQYCTSTHITRNEVLYERKSICQYCTSAHVDPCLGVWAAKLQHEVVDDAVEVHAIVVPRVEGYGIRVEGLGVRV